MGESKTHFVLMEDCIKSVKRGISTQRLNEENEESIETPFVGVKAVQQEGYVDNENVDWIKIRDRNTIKKATVTTGDLILTLRGSCIKCAVADSSVDGYAISANLIALTLTEKIKPEIVAAYLNGPVGQRELTKRAGGTTMLSLNLKRLKEVPIPIRSIEEQETILRFIKLSNQYRKNLVKELELWDNMRESFIVKRLGI